MRFHSVCIYLRMARIRINIVVSTLSCFWQRQMYRDLSFLFFFLTLLIRNLWKNLWKKSRSRKYNYISEKRYEIKKNFYIDTKSLVALRSFSFFFLTLFNRSRDRMYPMILPRRKDRVKCYGFTASQMVEY